MLVMLVATFSLHRNFLAGISLSAYQRPMKVRNGQLALVGKCGSWPPKKIAVSDG